MTLKNNYIIKPSHSFERELSEIYIYLKHTLNCTAAADDFYNKVSKKIFSLKFLPERYTKISNFQNKKRILRRFFIGKYVIIYEVNKNIGQISILHIFHSNQNYLNLL